MTTNTVSFPHNFALNFSYGMAMGIGLAIPLGATSYFLYQKIYPFYAIILKPLQNLQEPLSNLIKALKKKDITPYIQDASIELKELLKILQITQDFSDKATFLKAQKKIQEGLYLFFSSSYFLQKKETLQTPNKKLTPLLLQLCKETQDPENEVTSFQFLLQECQETIQTIIQQNQGPLKKIQIETKKKLEKKCHELLIPETPNPQDPFLLIREIRDLKKTFETLTLLPKEVKENILKFKLSQLGLQEINLQNLDHSVQNKLQNIQKEDSEGFAYILKTHPKQTSPYDLLAHYLKYRSECPKKPSLLERFQYKKKTTFAKEQNRLMDFFGLSFLWVYFSSIYTTNSTLEKKFHDLIAASYALSSEGKEQKCLTFFKEIHKNSTISWIPFTFFWKGGHFLFLRIKQIRTCFLSKTPLFTFVAKEITEHPLSAMTSLSKKISRLFHFLKITHGDWSQHHPYEINSDTYLANVLDKNQKQILRFPHLNFLKRGFNLIAVLTNLQIDLATWVNRPSLDPMHPLSCFNLPLKASKQFVKIFINLFLLGTKVVFAPFQYLFHSLIELILKKILTQTPLIDQINQKIVKEITYDSPFKFAILEAILPILKEMEKAIKTSPPSSYPIFEGESKMKRALQEVFMTTFNFAKTQETLNPSSNSQEMLFLENISPVLIDILYHAFLKILASYKEKEILDQRKKGLLQAVIFFLYHKKSPAACGENQEALKKRYHLLKQEVSLSLQKICHSLIIQTSKEELPKSIETLVKKGLNRSSGSYLSPLKKSYLKKHLDLFLDFIKKPYLQKAFVLYLLSQDQNA